MVQTPVRQLRTTAAPARLQPLWTHRCLNDPFKVSMKGKLTYISEWNSFPNKKKTVRRGLDFVHGDWLDGLGCYWLISDEWQVAPPSSSSEKRRDVTARGKGSYFDTSFIVNTAIRIVTSWLKGIISIFFILKICIF